MKASRSWSSESLVWLRSSWRSVAPLLGAAVGLVWIYDPQSSPALFLALLLLWVAFLALALRRFRGSPPPVAAVLIVAGLLRILLLPLPLSVSDDAYRYIWDGRVVRSGFNPYLHAPDDEALEPLRDELWARVAHRDIETVYPPLAIGVFTVASFFTAPVLALKTILALVDMATCWLLLRYAARRRVPSVRVLAYAWNPLVVFETAGMGHVDALGLPWLLMAALLLDPVASAASRRMVSVGTTLKAAASLAAGVLAKLVPVLVLPVLARRSGRARLFALVVVAVVAAAFGPFLNGVRGVPPGLVAYGVSWEFNGPLFEPLWRALEMVRAPEAAKWALDRFARWGDGDTLGAVYPYLYPQFLAKVLLGLGLVGILLWSLRARDLAEAALRAFGGWLLVSATVYPWYLLWMLPWAALLGRRAWLVLSATIFFAYLPALFGIALLPWPYLLVWVPPLLTAIYRRRTV